MRYLAILVLSLILVSHVEAAYVMPYPSYMPGNRLYTLSRFLDSASKWWNFGSIASTKYALHLSDKYLVEAKTLFEYKQYLLAIDALQRSDKQVKSLHLKTGGQLRQMIREAMAVHKNVLSKLRQEVPEQYVWRPEKEEQTVLPLWKLIDASIGIRETLDGNL